MILTAGWVVPISTPPICGGFIQILGSQIAAVGPAGAAPPDAERLDLGADVVLLPGLVNAHTHLELTGYAGLIPPGPFWPWVQALIRLRNAPGQREREQCGVIRGVWQSLRAGVTCVGDISRTNLHWEVLKPLPIRKVCFVELLSLADEPPRDADELRAAVESVACDERLTVGISPHAPWSVDPLAVQGAIALADERRLPWTMHWCETPEEVAFLREGPERLPDWVQAALRRRGLTSPKLAPEVYLESVSRAPEQEGSASVLRKDKNRHTQPSLPPAARHPGRETGAGCYPGLLAHANYLDDAACAGLAAQGHAVVYCPRAHRYFGHAPHPLPRLLAAGVRVVLGTDSAASNADLDLLEEVRFVAREHPTLAPERLLRMVTLDAAAALGGLDERIGSLDCGKQADLTALQLIGPQGARLDEPGELLRRIIDGPNEVVAVWVSGVQVL